MKKTAYLKLIVMLLASAAISGCQFSEPLKMNSLIENNTAGRSVQGRSIPCYSYGTGSDVVMVIATIHGNESAGTPLSYKLIDYLRSHTEYIKSRTVVIIPMANPDGFYANTRHNSRGIDLNRNFETSNRENNTVNGFSGLTEPESVFIKNIIDQYKPDRIISIHAPLACIDYDGPGQTLAEHLGNYCGLPAKKLGSRPGSLGSYAGNTLMIPILTLELTEKDENSSANTLWHKYGDMLLAFINYPMPPM